MTTATKPSTPRLSEAARHVVKPSGIVSTGWPRIQRRLADMAIEFDPWQVGATQLILGRRDNGRYAATVGGVVMSIPRQVGKTFMVGALIVAMCLEYPGLTVLWTAHRIRTSTRTFQSMQGMVQRKRIRAHLAPGRSDGIRRANGEQEIKFANGSEILFGAREQGFGRGFEAVDVEIFDEAQILTEKALDDMVPATNQAKHPHGALLFFIGTPPRPVDPGDVFTGKRKEALAGADDMVYIEFSADPNADINDQGQMAKANPSFPARTPLESMQRMWKNLGSDDSKRREGLGIWDEELAYSVFGDGAWARCRDDVPADYRVGAVGVAVSVDQASSAVVLAARSEDRAIPLPAHHEAGTGWVIDAAVAEASERRVPIIIDGNGPGGFLVQDMRKQARAKGVRVVEASLPNAKDACAAIFQQVASGELLHAGWDELDAAVAGARKREIGDRWLWGRRPIKGQRPADITPLEAATFALWGQDNTRTRSAADQRLAEGGSAVLSI